MPLREELQKGNSPFTGFVVTYATGEKVYEKENYFSKKLNKKCATNWAEIDKSRVSSIELLWNGESKVKLNKAPDDIHKRELTAKDWFFSHKGYLDMGTKKIKLLARNIGYIEDSILHITSVAEDTGEIFRSVRAAPAK